MDVHGYGWMDGMYGGMYMVCVVRYVRYLKRARTG